MSRHWAVWGLGLALIVLLVALGQQLERYYRPKPAPSMFAMFGRPKEPDRRMQPLVSSPMPDPVYQPGVLHVPPPNAPPPVAPITSAPAAPPQPPVTAAEPQHRMEELPGPFIEKPSAQEMPEIRLMDRTSSGRGTVSLVFTGPDGVDRRLWNSADITSLQLTAGTYHYALYGRYYRASGQPDQQGTFTCRRFRLYELPLEEVPLDQRLPRADLGDPD